MGWPYFPRERRSDEVQEHLTTSNFHDGAYIRAFKFLLTNGADVNKGFPIIAFAKELKTVTQEAIERLWHFFAEVLHTHSLDL